MDSMISKINYFSDKATFETINDSNSGAILRKVKDEENTYFLKIVPNNNIDIDKIQVKLPIYHGTNPSILNHACGHIEGSSFPIAGKGTHAALSAHRGLPSAKLFSDLDKLDVGDTFRVTVLDTTYIYEVDQIKTVLPNDVSDLLIDEDKEYCTLVTCTPYGINSHRLLVRGHRIESEDKRTLNAVSEAYIIDRLIVTPIVALPIIFILMLYVFFKPVKKKLPINEDGELI